MAWNLFYDPRVDCLERRGAFLSHDFGLPRRGSSSAVQFGGLDFLHSSSGTSSSSAWALGLISNGPESPDPLAPHVSLRVCLRSAYFAKIEIFLLKVLYIKINVS